MSKLFNETKTFKQAVDLINQFNPGKFTAFLKRVLTKLGTEKGGKIFSEKEEAMFMEMFELSAPEMEILTEGVCYVFEQAAYLSLKPKTFASQLEKTSMDEQKAKVFVSVWEAKGEAYINSLRESSFGYPPTVSDVRWEVHLPLSSSVTKLDRAPVAEIQLSYEESPTAFQPSTSYTSSAASSSSTSSSSSVVVNDSAEKENNEKTTHESSILFELNHAELSQFARQLEMIQQQLDTITS